jgi:hypothetical protein
MMRLVFLALLMMSSAAIAADGKPPRALVEQLSKRAHDGFLTVKNAEGQTIVKPEDAKKLSYPLVPYEEREMAVARGYLSAKAKWCGLDWGKDYFAPYKLSLQKKHQKNWTPHQYAYVEVVHGTAMGFASQDYKEKKCSAEEKKSVAALAKK